AIPRVLIPPFPGCTSAFGAVISGSRRDFLRTVGRRLDRLDVAALAALTAELRAEADAALALEHYEAADRFVETWLDVRYQGQAHELSIRHAEAEIDAASIDRALGVFHALHRQLYGHAFTDVPVEIVNVRVKGLGRRPEMDMWWDWAAAGE